MADLFEGTAKSWGSPADRHFVIAPSDTEDLAFLPRAIRVGTAGTIVLRDAAGVDVSYAVEAGEILPFRVARVLATGTTATDLVGWY